MADLLGAKVRITWPDGGCADALGEIIHVAWRGAACGWPRYGPPGLLVRWDPPAVPRMTSVPDPSWLVTEDGRPLEIPPAIMTVSAGDLL